MKEKLVKTRPDQSIVKPCFLVFMRKFKIRKSD